MSPRCHEDAEADEAPGHHVDYEEAWNCILHCFLCNLALLSIGSTALIDNHAHAALLNMFCSR